jgi:hypothetical protein
LIAPLEEAGFTDRVLAVLGDQALRGRLAASAIEWAREWAAPQLALRLRGVYGSLHRASRGAPALTRDGADEGSSSLEGDDVGHRP